MKKLIILIAILLLIPISSFAKTAESKTSPPTLQKISANSYYYNYDIKEIEKTPEGGAPETWYQYSYVEIQGTPTKKKVLDAITQAQSSTVIADIEGVAVSRTAAQEKLAEISTMTYAQIDIYIENTFGGLSVGQKESLKTLYKAVLALIKNMDYD